MLSERKPTNQTTFCEQHSVTVGRKNPLLKETARLRQGNDARCAARRKEVRCCDRYGVTES